MIYQKFITNLTDHGASIINISEQFEENQRRHSDGKTHKITFASTNMTPARQLYILLSRGKFFF